MENRKISIREAAKLARDFQDSMEKKREESWARLIENINNSRPMTNEEKEMHNKFILEQFKASPKIMKISNKLRAKCNKLTKKEREIAHKIGTKIYDRKRS